jgi:peptide chain release factor 1
MPENADINVLRQRKLELERQLRDPAILREAAQVKEISMELQRLEKKIRAAERLGSDGAAPARVIVEIRAGVGGGEAALFTAELLRMYVAYAKRRGWEVVLIDTHPTTIGGYREAVLEIAGSGAYETLQYEAGVHRVQRIPATEKTGRIHTSTVSVAVLPEAKESDIEIRPQDIKVEFFRSSGPGGQNVNKVETAVRIQHLPSGLVVSSQESRSQQKNRELAMTLLRTKLLDAQREAEAEKTAQERREQIGKAERAEKIRTYNFPQDRVTDHRLKKSWHNIESVLAGNLDPIVGEFQR